MKIHKAVIPAAGWGTRFLPQTKSMPKEMLPVIDKPVIQYVVEEVVASGIKDIIIVTSWNKRAIEDHFDRSFDLEKYLQANNKEKEFKEIKRISQMANFIYIRQKKEGYGNALPVLEAKHLIGNEPFVVIWGDEFILAEPPRLIQMIDAYKKYAGTIISAVEIESDDQLSRYGIADLEPMGEKNIFRIKKIVEKPHPQEAPSKIAVHGAYILPPEIFEIIENLKPSRNGEFWLAEAIDILIQKNYPVYGCKIKNGRYYDTGNKIEYLKTVFEFALSHPDFSQELRKYLKNLI